MKIKRVITKVDRYLYKEEAKGIYNALLLNRDIEEKNLKIHKLTNQAYMIELKELKRRQENREIVQALQERKAQGEAI